MKISSEFLKKTSYTLLGVLAFAESLNPSIVLAKPKNPVSPKTPMLSEARDPLLTGELYCPETARRLYPGRFWPVARFSFLDSADSRRSILLRFQELNSGESGFIMYKKETPYSQQFDLTVYNSNTIPTIEGKELDLSAGAEYRVQILQADTVSELPSIFHSPETLLSDPNQPPIAQKELKVNCD